MIAAITQPTKRRYQWHHVATPERHTMIVLAIWRCYTDNGFWPEINYLTGQTGIPLTLLCTDLLHLIKEQFVAVRGWEYKLIVRREV